MRIIIISTVEKRFNTVIWEVREHTDNSITFYHYSSETEQKFRQHGDYRYIRLQMMIHCICVYNGKADADTVMNCTNHSYFNLNGHESEVLKRQVLQIFADAYTPVGFKCDSDRRDCIGGGNADGFPNRKTD